MSVHAPPGDIIKIMETGIIEGLTISYSVLNQAIMQPVLNRAAELDIGLILMNPLGGGIIPQNPDFFSFLKQPEDKTVSQAALSYVYAHPQITCLLSGMTNVNQLEENIETLSRVETPEAAKQRIKNTNKELIDLKGFCTGCGYCDGCPENINIKALMHSYNATFFKEGLPVVARGDKRMIENLSFWHKLLTNFYFIPDDTKNPCRKCGECEKKCTQSLPVIKMIEEIYERLEESGFSKRHIRNKILDIFKDEYCKIALYPSGRFTSQVLDSLYEYKPDLKAEIFLFDKDKKLFGTFANEIEIRNPDDILKIKPDIVVITNYQYQAEIYNSLKYLEESNIKVVKLYGQREVPWRF
jgi:ferredoxin